MNNFEKKFEGIVAGVQSTKIQIEDAKKVTADVKRECDELRKSFNNLENKFDNIIVEVRSSKAQLEESKKEMLVVKGENVELQAQIIASTNAVEKLREKVRNLKKKIVTKVENVDQNTAFTAADTANAWSPRKIFHKLPCKSPAEINWLRNELKEVEVIIYMVSVFQSRRLSSKASIIY